ncbi:MAG TPA: aspartate--tRNA ligase, partial [Gaiellaceae bacterium]|nr:aspartate--tRNA ligase [Gaiellaceae bacterium]
MSWRDAMCGEVLPDRVGSRLTLAGWADARRDHGGLIFVDLRDSSGLCQLVVNPERAPGAAEAAHAVRNEYVLRAEGEVVRRAPENVNPDLPTGEVELQVDSLEIVSRCPPLPFQLEEEGVDETLRIRYRWIDLRRPRLQRNVRMRAQMISIIRREMDAAGFVEIETPVMAKPTPEGARDFLVPTRLQPGRFFALPQSPQIYKQLLVISGFERYYQIARCFRDEDLRADRVQEITQLDLEMAFPDREVIFGLMERVFSAVWRECIGAELGAPFPRMSFDEVMRRYGTDKPDLRFGLEIEDATEVTRGSEFGVFAGAPCVRFLRVPRAYSRAELERLEAAAKEWGATGLAYLVYPEDGDVRSPIAKFLSATELEALRSGPGTTLLFGAGEPAVVSRVLGALRLLVGDELGLVDEAAWRPLWVVDFPMFDWDDDEQAWKANHHPFTSPTPESEPLLDTDPGAAVAQAYDLVVNGVELGSGSIRIHRPELQAKVFDVLRISPEEQRSR